MAASAEETLEHADHRRRPRRRGAALEQAIMQAALDELAEVGYPDLTMEGIAARARTSKTALYRRWPSTAVLLIDAYLAMAPAVPVPDTGALRTDLLALLRAAAELFDTQVGRTGVALLGEMTRDPELAQVIRERIVNLQPEALLTVLARADARGEIQLDRLPPRVRTLAVVLFRHELMVHGPPVPDTTLVEIVDQVCLPLLRGGPAGSPA